MYPMRLSTKDLPMEACVFAKSRWYNNAWKPPLRYGRPGSGKTLVLKRLNHFRGVTCNGEVLNGFLFSKVALISRLPQRVGENASGYGINPDTVHRAGEGSHGSGDLLTRVLHKGPLFVSTRRP